MLQKLSVKETSIIVCERKSHSICGLTAQLRNQFAVMIPGESFIYPLPEGMTSKEVSARIRGTCHSMKVSIRTKKMDSGVLVVYKGEK